MSFKTYVLFIMSKTNKGFTLIELLVVIAIIGILSSVVLASLNSARNKGADANIKANLANARAQAELYYDGNSSSYNTLCTAAGGISGIVAGLNAVSSDVDCFAATSTWALSAQLKSVSTYWCVDNTGTSTSRATAVSTSNC